MGKLFRRIICFLLGMIVGLTGTVASTAGTLYYLYGNVTVENVANNVEELGEFNGYSAEDIVGFLQKAVASPDSYTLKDLEDKMGVDFVNLVNRLAGTTVIKDGEENSKYVDDLKTVSLFTLLTDQGFAKFVSDLPVGAVLAFLPDNIISEQERAKLRRYTVGQLIATDEFTGQKGVFSALRDISLGGLLPTLFDYVDGEYVAKDSQNKPLELLANVKMGAIIDTFVTKSSDLPTEIVEGGLSSVGSSSVGELIGKAVTDEQIVSRIDSLFNGIKIRDLFTKDAETGKYVFSIENLTDNIRIGGVIGYTYNEEDGKWYTDAEMTTPAKGILKVISSLDVTTFYLAIKDEGTAAEKIQKILNGFGEFSIGDIFETIGFEKGEDGLWYKDGNAINSTLVSALLELSVRDVVGEGELTAKQIVQNLTSALEGYFGDMTVGEGLGELFGVVKNENGEYVYKDESKGELNPLLKAVCTVKVADFFAELAKGETISVETVLSIFKNAFAGLRLGDVLGMKYADGKWYDANGNETNQYLGVLCDLELTAIFAIVENPGSASAIVKGFLPDLTLGNLAVALLNFGAEGEGEDTKYYTKSDDMSEATALSDGLNRLLNIEIWKFVAGFDKNSDFDLLDAIGDITVGDALNFRLGEDGVWYFRNSAVKQGNAVYFPGAAGKLLGYRLGDLFDPAIQASEFVDDLKTITVGGIFQTLLGIKVNEDGTTESLNGVPSNKAFDVICGCTISIQDIISSIKGEQKLNVEEELHKLFDGVRIGEFLAQPLSIEENEEGILTSAKTEKLNGVLNLVYNFDCGNLITYIYSIVNKQTLTVDDILDDVFAGPFADYEIGDLIAPAIGLSKEGGVWIKDGKTLKKAVDSLFSVKVRETIGKLASKDSLSDKIDYLVGLFEGVGVGDIVALFADVSKTGDDWSVNGKKMLPFVSNALDIDSVAVKGYIDEFRKSPKAGAFAVVKDLFEELTVGECFPDLNSSNPALTKLLGTVVTEVFGYELDIEGYTDATFPEVTGVKKVDYLLNIVGDITIGDIVNKTATKAVLTDLYAIRLGDILGVAGKAIRAKFSVASLKQAAFDLVELYVHDYPLSRYLNANGNAALETLFAVKPIEVVGYELDIEGYTDATFPEVTGVKKVDYLLNIVGDITIGEIVNKTGTKTAIKDLFAIRVGDVLGIVGDVVKAKASVASLKQAGYDLVYLYAGENTISRYYTNTNPALAKILETKISEIVGVELGIAEYDSVAVEEVVGNRKIDYLLGIVGDVTIGEIVNKTSTWAVLIDLFEIRVGDVLGIVGDVVKAKASVASLKQAGFDLVYLYAGDSAISRYYTNDNPALAKILDTKISEVVGYELDIEGYTDATFPEVTGVKKVDYLLNIVGDITIGEIVNKTGTINLQKDLFAIRVGDVLAIVGNTVRAKFSVASLKQAGFDLVKLYAHDYPLSRYLNAKGNAALETLYAVKPIEVVGYELDIEGYTDVTFPEVTGVKKVDYLLNIVGDITIGEIVNKTGTINLQKDLFAIRVGDVLAIVGNTVRAKFSVASLKQAGFDLVELYAHDYPLSRYLNAKGNAALETLYAVKPIEVVGYELDIEGYTDVTFPEVTGVKKVDYLLNIVGDITIGEIVNKTGTKTAIKDLFAIRVGDVLGIVGDVVKAKASVASLKQAGFDLVYLYAGENTISRYYTNTNPALAKILETKISEIVGVELGIAEYDSVAVEEVVGNRKIDYLLGIVGDVTIGEIVNKTATKAVLADLFEIRVGDVLAIVGNTVRAKFSVASLKQAGYDLVYLYATDYTFARYVAAQSNPAVNKLLTTEVKETASVLLGLTDPYEAPIGAAKITGIKQADYLLGLLDGVTIGDVVNKTGTKLLTQDLFGTDIGDILRIAGDVAQAKASKESLQKGVYDLVSLIATDRTVYDYASDLAGKSFRPDGVNILLENLKIAEFVGVMSGYLDAYAAPISVENFLGEGRIDYVLAIADTVKIGNFLSAYTYNGSAWEKNGTEVKSFGNALLNVTGKTVIVAVCALFMPNKVLEMYGDTRLGFFLATPYNNLLGTAFSTEATGDKDVGYTVTGSFKTMAETLFNLTPNDVVNPIKDKTFKAWVYATFNTWTVRDVSYDLLKKYLPAKLGVTFDGFACDGNEVTGTMAAVFNAAFPVTAATIWSTLKNKTFYTFVMDTFGEIRFGDFVKDYETKTWKIVVKDALELTVGDVLPIVRDVVKAKASVASLKQGAYDLVYAYAGDNTLARYINDNGNPALQKLLTAQPKEIAGYELGIEEYAGLVFPEVTGVKKIDYLLSLIGEVTIGDAVNKTSSKAVFVDLFALKTGDILAIVGDVIRAKGSADSIKTAVYDLVYLYASDNSVSRYISNGNPAISKVLETKVCEVVGVELGVAEYDAVSVTSVIGNRKVDYLLGLFGDVTIGELVNKTATKVALADLFAIKVGDILGVVGEVVTAKGSADSLKQAAYDLTYLYAGENAISRYYTNSNPAISKVLETKVCEIVGVELGIAEYDGVSVTSVIGNRKVDYLLGLFGDVTIGELVNKTATKVALADLFAIKVGDVLGVVGEVVTAKGSADSLKQAAYDLTYLYAGDNKLSRYFNNSNPAIAKVLETKVCEVVGVEIGIAEYDAVAVASVIGNRKVDYLLRLFDDVTLAELTGISSTKALITDTLALTGKVVLDSVADVKASKDNVKPVVYNVVKEIAAEKTVQDYFTDWTGKRFTNDGMNVLLESLKIAEFTGVMLDQIDAYADLSVEEFAGNGKVDYILTIADRVKIGNFMKAYVYDEVADQWTKGGQAVKSLVNTALNVTGKQVVIAVYALINPQVVVDRYGDRKIGYVLAKPYNTVFAKLDTEAAGDSVNGYTVTGSFKTVAEILMNTTVSEAYDVVKGGVSGIKTYINDNFMTLKVGDYAYDLVRKFASAKLGLGLEGYAYEAVDAAGNYVADANFKAILDETFNITVREVYDAVKGRATGIKNFVSDHYMTMKIGDYAYDLVRKFASAKLGLGLEGYAYEAVDAAGNYVADANFKAILDETFNITVREVYDAVKGKATGIKNFVKAHYFDMTVGDFTFDLFRKFIASRVRLTATGYAYEGYNVSGKLQKVASATFAITVGDAYGYVRNKDVYGLVIDGYGALTLGDFIGAVVDKALSSRLLFTVGYAEDYTATVVDGNFKEIFNTAFAINVGELASALKAKTIKDFFIGEHGAFADIPLGHVIGYLSKKTLEGKGTTVNRGGDGSWILTGAFEKPLNVAFNDITLYTVIKARTDIKNGIILPYFGDILLGELLGGYCDAEGNWHKSNGDLVGTGSGKDAIMNNAYGLKVSEILAEDFNVEQVFEGMYLGEAMGYNAVAHADYCDPDCAVTDPAHKHKYYWMNGETAVEPIINSVCNVLLTDVLNGRFAVDDILGGMKLGAAIGYTNNGSTWVDKNGTAVTGVLNKVYDIDLGNVLANGITLNTMFGEMKLGEAMNFTYYPGEGVWKKSDGSVVDPVIGKLANLRLTNVLDGNFNVASTLAGLKLGAAVGYTNNGSAWVDNEGHPVTGVLNKVYDLDLGNVLEHGITLNAMFGDMMLGEAMGYEAVAQVDHCDPGCTTDHTHNFYWKKDGSAVKVLYQKLANVKLIDVLNGNLNIEGTFGGVYVGELMGYIKTVSGWKKSDGVTDVTGVNKVVADLDVGAIMNGTVDIEDEIKSLELGEVITIGEDSPIALKSLKTTKVGELSTRFDTLTLKEVIAIDPATSPTILVLLKDTKINELGTKINELYLGSIMGYTKEGTVWYDGSHNPASNMVKILADYQVKDLDGDFASDILNDIKTTLTVTDVFGTIESTSPLSLIQDEKIGDIQTELPEKIKTAPIQTLIATGILPLTAAQQATLTSKFGESWKSMNITQFFDMLISAISYMPDIP